MANIMDYLDWRGDLNFEDSPFNEVDNLILAQLVYVDFEGIVPGVESSESIGLKEASELFFKRHTELEILERVSMTKMSAFVLKKMAQTRRFEKVRLSKYVNDISLEEQSQFSVVLITFEDQSIYVSFSGTDSTIVGWRENFNMGYLKETPGQKKAAAYLNRVITQEHQVIRVGGHSKGGNLSVYASVKCNPDIQRRIVMVFSNDGPGFSREMLDSNEYKRIQPRIRSILPESSIVGMLLEHEDRYEVVKSSQSGIQQHDAMSWEVLGTTFVYVENIALQSVMLDETMKNWLHQLDGEQREAIISTVFNMLEDAKIRTVDDFYHIKWKKIQELMRAKSELPEETQQLFSEAIKLLWKAGNDTVKRQMKQNKSERHEETQNRIKMNKANDSEALSELYQKI